LLALVVAAYHCEPAAGATDGVELVDEDDRVDAVLPAKVIPSRGPDFGSAKAQSPRDQLQ
jgi:hypothetical protein